MEPEARAALRGALRLRPLEPKLWLARLCGPRGT
jgi:hypothetical protein